MLVMPVTTMLSIRFEPVVDEAAASVFTKRKIREVWWSAAAGRLKVFV